MKGQESNKQKPHKNYPPSCNLIGSNYEVSILWRMLVWLFASVGLQWREWGAAAARATQTSQCRASQSVGTRLTMSCCSVLSLSLASSHHSHCCSLTRPLLTRKPAISAAHYSDRHYVTRKLILNTIIGILYGIYSTAVAAVGQNVSGGVSQLCSELM